MEQVLKGKVALVTGGSRGLGFAMTIGLAQAGADIVNVGRGADEEIKKEVESLGRKYHYIQCDLSTLTHENADKLVAEAIDVMGQVDILLNNAGANKRTPFVEFAEKDWDFLLNLNLKSVFLLGQSVATYMVKNNRKGKIINIASMLSFTGGFIVPAYTASKSGVMGLTKEMSNELSRYGINVNAIAPGYMDTEITKDIQNDPIRNQEILSRLPIGYWGKPEVLQGAVVFLASSASDYVCGATIPVDGGWLGR